MMRTTPSARLFTRCLGPASLALLAIAGCSTDDNSTSSTLQLTPRVAITSVKDDPESQLIAAIYARVLEDAGFRVARRDPVDLDRAGYYQAMQDGDFQLIPEYSGDLLAFVYSQPDAGPAPSTVVPSEPAITQAPITIPTTTTAAPTTTTDGSSTTTGDATTTTEDSATTTDDSSTTTDDTTTTVEATTTVVETSTTIPVPITNGRTLVEQVAAINAGLPSTLIACTPAAMAANAETLLITLTDLASIAPNIRLGGSAEFMADEEIGFPAMELFYGGEFKDTVTVEQADLATAIDEDTADCFAINSLDPLITTKQLTILIDDQTMVPSNAVIAMVSSTINTPDLITVLDSLSLNLTTERLNQMLNAIATGTDPSVVANAFVDTI